MEQLNRTDATAFYDKYYRPNNAVLIVAGDVEPDDVRALAEKTFGKVARGPDLPPRIRPVEPEQNTKRTVTLSDARVSVPSFSTQWVVPSYHSGKPGEAEALDLLAEILGGGTRSRLYQELVVKQGIASGAGAYFQGTMLDDTNFTVYGAPRGDAKLADVEAAVDVEVARIARDGVTPVGAGKGQGPLRQVDDLCPRQAGFHGQHLRLDTGHRRQRAGRPAMAGPHPQGHRRRGQGRRRALSGARPVDDRLSAAAATGGELMMMSNLHAPGALHSALAGTFSPLREKRLAAALDETPAPRSASSHRLNPSAWSATPSPTRGEGKLHGAALATLFLSILFLILPALTARAMDIQSVTSPKGITAWLVEDYSVPVVAIRFVFGGGSTQDPVGKEGLANLMTGLFDEGAGPLDSEAFQIRLDDAGAEMSFEESRDGIYGSMRMLAEQRDEAFDLLRLAVNEPRFDQAADRPHPRPDPVRHHRRRERPRYGGAGQMGARTLRRSSLFPLRPGHQAEHRRHHAG